jgi:hypothetical protein
VVHIKAAITGLHGAAIDTPLGYTIFHKQKRQAEVVTAKQIDRVLLNQSKAHKPGPNHPWNITPVVSK